MKLRVGYACINLSLKQNFRSFRLKTVEDQAEEKITEVLWHNMRLLRETIIYNIKHNIYVYRFSSDLVPFCAHPYMQQLYQEKILNNEEMMGIFEEIKALRTEYNLRLSIHPSQFNVLSSPKEDIVKRSIEEINAQTEWIKRVGGDNVVLHMGGVYNDKAAAVSRLKAHLNYIDRDLISIENDDKSYEAEDVYNLCEAEHLKWVFDFHHHRCLPIEEEKLRSYIKAYPPDKYHLSTGNPNQTSRPHADYISTEDYQAFNKFLESCGVQEADVVFEAKKKNKAIFHILKPLGEGYWELDGSV